MKDKIMGGIVIIITFTAFMGIFIFACGIEDPYGNKQIECVIGLFICLMWFAWLGFMGNLEEKRYNKRRR